MKHEMKTWLFDILQSIEEIESYLSDTKTQRAVERNLEIIGARNRIIHGYDRISQEVIWSIVIIHLPKLQAEVSELIGTRQFGIFRLKKSPL